MRLIIIAALTTLILPVIAIMGCNYYADPYQYYRKWSGPEPIFSTKGRYQNPGLIKHYDYDTVIIGTSRSQNFTPAMFADSGWRVIKLTASGSASYVQATTLKLALETGKVKRAIVELSASSYQFGPKHMRQGKAFPAFLYEPTLETPFLYLLSYDLFQQSKRVLQGRAASSSLGDLNVWQQRYQQDFGQNRYLENVRLDCDPLGGIPFSWTGDYPEMDLALDENLAALIAAYPTVEFLGFMPPYPTSWFGKVSETERRVQLGFRQRIHGFAKRFPNFRAFDFALMDQIVNDPNRYKDFNHYDQSVNRAMADALMTGRWEIDDQDPIEAERTLRRVVAAFDWRRWSPCEIPGSEAPVASASW